MNQINYKWVIKKEGFDQAKRLGYKVLSKQLSPETIKRGLDFFDKIDDKLKSRQKKINLGTKVVWGLEKGSPILTRAGKVANKVNSYYKVSGLDTVETAGHLAEYSKSRKLSNKGQTIYELLQTIREKVARAKLAFQCLNDIQKQKARQEEFVDIQQRINAIDFLKNYNEEQWEGSYELEDFEDEEALVQEKRNKQLSKGWDLVDEKEAQREVKRKIGGWIKTEGKLKSNLLDAINDENDYKSQVQPATEEEWVEWNEIAKLTTKIKKDSFILQYAKKGQNLFKVADEKVEAFSLELDTITELVKEVQKQLDYSLAKKGLAKAHKDSEELKHDLDKVVKWVAKIKDRVNHYHSYVEVGGKLANTIVRSVNNFEKYSEYTKLTKNPYAYNDRVNEVIVEDDFEVLEQVENKEAKVEEKPKSWTNWLLGK